MEDVKAKVANRLKEANNVLVSVTNNPSVDQFAAAIAMTLILNKLGKHATTVFSGTIPSTVEFLQPEKVVEKNTDSLRDFIISLDKSKADKLRYKIEDNFVKIFITPYHTSISEKDLVFSQGDFNVDVVLGLGVHQREELDQAITAHGRILHDATVITVNTEPPSNLGSINWADSKSSSVCEMLVVLSDLLAKQGLFDTQISNALLTGIVAETQRFSNQKTTPVTMSASSQLLAAGANQQLVATQLAPKPPAEVVASPSNETPKDAKTETETDKKSPPGELKIEHGTAAEGESAGSKVAQVSIDDEGTLQKVDESPTPPAEAPKVEPPPIDKPAEPAQLPPVAQDYVPPPLIPIPPDSPAPASPPTDNSESSQKPGVEGPKLVLEPPSIMGQLNSNTAGNGDEESFPDPLSSSNLGTSTNSAVPPMLNHDIGPISATRSEVPQPDPPTPSQQPQASTNPNGLPNLDEVRSAIDAALSSGPANVSNQPLASLNAQPVNLDLNHSNMQPQSTPSNEPQPTPFTMPMAPPVNNQPQPPVTPPAEQATMPPPPTSAPPVPPPIILQNQPDNNAPPSYTAL